MSIANLRTMNRFLVIIISGLLAIYGRLNAQSNLQLVTNWAYQLQNININAVAANDSFQLMVSDYSHDGTDNNKLTPAEVATVKNSGKLFISYISIGEAENYRSYWQNSWTTGSPAWLDSVNPDWPGNYKVRYWDTAWQQIIFNYIDTIIHQGFHGAYLDIIDAWYYWQSEVSAGRQIPNADSLMIDFVLKIRNHVDSVTGTSGFIIMPQNGEDLIFQNNLSSTQRNQYYNAINALGVEDVFFTGTNNEDNPFAPDYYRINNLQLYQAQGKKIFNIEYLTQTDKIKEYKDTARFYSFVPYACTRALDQLCSAIPLAIPVVSDGDLKIYPNPVNGNEVFIHSKIPFSATSRMELLDMAGRVISTEPFLLSYQMNDAQINIPASIPNGIYNLHVQANAQSSNNRIVVIR